MLYAVIYGVEKKDGSTKDTLFVTDEMGEEVKMSVNLDGLNVPGITGKLYDEINIYDA